MIVSLRSTFLNRELRIYLRSPFAGKIAKRSFLCIKVLGREDTLKMLQRFPDGFLRWISSLDNTHTVSICSVCGNISTGVKPSAL